MEKLSLNKAAKVVGMNPGTVRRWCRSGKLKSERYGFRKEIRIDRRDLIKLCIDNGYIINDEELKG